MRLLSRLSVLVLALALVSTAMAGEADPLAQLDAALKGAATFEYGKDSAPLVTVESIVIAAATDAKLRAEVEQRLLKTLTGKATTDCKAFVCRQLRTIGSPVCVPMLEPLLTDPKLSHMARYALGRIECQASLDALHRALRKTSGKLQAGMAATLGDRRCVAALPDLIKLLGSSDVMVAENAASALGRIGGAKALTALQAARPKAKRRLLERVTDALLACASQLVAEGKRDDAARVYHGFYSPKEPEHVRIAALRGLVAAWGPKATTLLVAAIRSDDLKLQRSAIALTETLQGPEATKTLAAILPQLTPQGQELMVRALAARADAAAAPAVVAAARSEDEPVRIAAIEALGSVGDASTIALLLERATTSGGQEQQVARSSLVRLKGEATDAKLIQSATAGDPKQRVEAIRALAGRKTAKAAAPLLKVARDQDATVRREAIRALGAVGGEADLPALLAFAIQAKDKGDRSSAEGAVAAVFRRVPDPEKQAAPVLAALAGAPTAAKPTLLKLLGRAATPKALAAVRAATKDADEGVQDAAIRTLSEWPDVAPADELLALAGTAKKQIHKVLALRGYVRMAGMSKDPTAMYVRAMKLAERPEDKKLVLGGLGTADSPQALELVEKHLKDPQLRNEAALAAIQIATKLKDRDAGRARATAKSVLAAVEDAGIRQQAQDIINEMEQHEGYIRVWLVSEICRIKGKDSRAVFDTASPPEEPDAKDVKWTPLTKGVGKWDINLEATFGGQDHCAAYVRTRVLSPTDQPVQLEMGSDDALKVWLNGKAIHANYVNRGCAARQDLVKAALAKGWNVLMLKVIDHEGGWAFCCRVRKPDGSAIEGLKYEAK